MADMTIAQVEIAAPGFVAMTGKLAIPETARDEPMDLDEVAIQLHEMVNSLVMNIRLVTEQQK